MPCTVSESTTKESAASLVGVKTKICSRPPWPKMPPAQLPTERFELSGPAESPSWEPKLATVALAQAAEASQAGSAAQSASKQSKRPSPSSSSSLSQISRVCSQKPLSKLQPALLSQSDAAWQAGRHW